MKSLSDTSVQFVKGVGPQKKKRILAFSVFLITLFVSLLSINHYEQLGRMSGLTEEYTDVAKYLLEYGMEYPHDEIQYVYRPPGYIFFLKTILRFPSHIPRTDGKELEQAIEHFKMIPEWRSTPVFELENKLIFAAQAVFFGGSALVLFLLLCRFSSLRQAFLLAIAYGLNVYLIILVGMYHYSVVHLFFVMLSCYVTVLALEKKEAQTALLLLSGIFWGLTTLIRPTTLILPVFFLVFLVFYFKKDTKKIVPSIMMFSLGMLLAVFPQTCKNYSKTHRIIPVNAQTWIVLWANTVEQGKVSQNHANWWSIWSSKGMPIYQRVTNKESYYFLNIIKYNMELEDAFKAETIKNLKHQPQVLVKNLMRNFGSFFMNINSVTINIFQALQEKDSSSVDMLEWVRPGHPQGFYPPHAQRLFEGLHFYLLFLSGFGTYFAFLKKEKTVLFLFCVFLCFAIAHTITAVGFMYYYIKMPFLILLSGYTIVCATQSKLTFWPKSVLLNYGNLALVILLSLEFILLYLVFLPAV
nr:hypothetical protein [uncultured bacterium]